MARSTCQVAVKPEASASEGSLPIASYPLSKPKKLVLIAGRLEDVDDTVSMLESAGLPHIDRVVSESNELIVLVPQQHVGRLDQVPAWHASNPDSHLLLLVPAPVLFAAALLSDGIRPTDALAAWADIARQALNLVRAIGRRRSSVFLAESVRLQPNKFLKVLGERLQIPLDLRLFADDSATGFLPDAKCRLTAQNAIWQSSEVRALVAEIGAMTVPLSEDEVEVVPAADEVFEDYRKTTGAAADHALMERQALIAAKTDELSDAHQIIKELREENDLILRKLHDVQEQVEVRHSGYDVGSEELIEAQTTIEALVNSMSWKITRPLRWILGILTGKKAHL